MPTAEPNVDERAKSVLVCELEKGHHVRGRISGVNEEHRPRRVHDQRREHRGDRSSAVDTKQPLTTTSTLFVNPANQRIQRTKKKGFDPFGQGRGSKPILDLMVCACVFVFCLFYVCQCACSRAYLPRRTDQATTKRH